MNTARVGVLISPVGVLLDGDISDIPVISKLPSKIKDQMEMRTQTSPLDFRPMIVSIIVRKRFGISFEEEEREKEPIDGKRRETNGE